MYNQLIAVIKKPSLTKDDLYNYRTIAKLSFTFTLTEQKCQKRLLDHLNANSLFNPLKSAYTKFYSTETTLLSRYDHLSNTFSKHQVSCLCLLDLSAAFDILTTPSASSYIYLVWHLISFITMVRFISFIPHFCRSHPSTHFSFIFSYLRSSPGLRPRPSSFQSRLQIDAIKNEGCLVRTTSRTVFSRPTADHQTATVLQCGTTLAHLPLVAAD